MAKTPEHFLSRRAFLHMFVIIISWLVFIPAIYSPHGPACPARARGLLGNDLGAVGVVFTILRGHRAWTDLKKRHFEATLYFSYTLQTMWYQSEAAHLLWQLVSDLWEKTKHRLIQQLTATGRAVHGHTAATHTSLPVCVICYKWRSNFQASSHNRHFLGCNIQDPRRMMKLVQLQIDPDPGNSWTRGLKLKWMCGTGASVFSHWWIWTVSVSVCPPCPHGAIFLPW